MERKHQTALAALATAGALWGLTVPLSKLALAWLGPAWLTAVRFALCAPVLAVLARRTLRPAISPRVVLTGAIGFGAVILLQNAGIERTSVSHAAVVVGAVPLLVALITAALGRGRVNAQAWSGFVLALGGIALVAGAGGGGATLLGDLLVLASAVLSAAFIVAQARVLDGRDATAVTAVQFAAGAAVSLPVALAAEGLPRGPSAGGPVLALVALSAAGTLMAFWLFAFGQTRVQPQLAGAFVNLEPVVGAALGWLAFGNAATLEQLGGAVAVLSGIALSTMPATRLAPSEALATPTPRAETRPRGCSGSRRPNGRRRAPQAGGRRRRAGERRPPRAGARSP
jgi:drug/metabolite transporter (DMT)-like permease